MANAHGGARPGAGRPKKEQKHAGAIERAEKKCADRLPRVISNIVRLADGGYKRDTEVWKPAGLIQIVRTEEVETEKGPKILRHLEPAFPDLKATEMVCIERRSEIADADLRANVYLADRILGKPTTRIEVEETPEEEVDEALDQAIFEVYGDKTNAENDENDSSEDERLEADEDETETGAQSAAVNF